VIGALLLANGLFEEVSWLAAESFYQDRHRRIWQCIVRMLGAGKPADLMTVCEELQRLGDLDKAGGAGYIAGLAQNTPSALNLKRYADIVEERAVQRKLAQVGTEIAESAYRPGTLEIGQLLDEAEQKIFGLSEQRDRGDGPKEIGAYLSKVFERIDDLHQRDSVSTVTGVPTGFLDLDERTAGMQPQDLIIVAGRPSMGKTAFALNVVEHVALSSAFRWRSSRWK
jgi:replicative DNA helicase